MVWLHPVPGFFVHAPTRYDHTVAMAAVYRQSGYPSEGGSRASSLAGSRHLDGDSVSPHRKGPNLLICAVEAPGVERGSGHYAGGCGSDPERTFWRRIGRLGGLSTRWEHAGRSRRIGVV